MDDVQRMATRIWTPNFGTVEKRAESMVYNGEIKMNIEMKGEEVWQDSG